MSSLLNKQIASNFIRTVQLSEHNRYKERSVKIVILTCLSFASMAWPQHRKVDPRNTYQRIIAIVPMVGTGTAADPKRPMYAPAARTSPTAAASGIIAYSFQVSDDGRYALAEFVARDRAAFAAILADQQVKAFTKGKDKKDDIEKELKKYKKDFDLEKFGLVVP